MTLYTEIWLGRAWSSPTLVDKLSIWLDYVRIPYNYVFCPICVWCNISTVYIHRCVHMGLCQYIDLCFHAPCLHTFWHAILHLFTFFYFSCLVLITFSLSTHNNRTPGISQGKSLGSSPLYTQTCIYFTCCFSGVVPVVSSPNPTRAERVYVWWHPADSLGFIKNS